MECAQPKASFMLTRVIEIDRDSMIWNLLLRQTSKSAVESYTALSCCWGGGQKSKTIGLAHAQVQNSYEAVPKMIQDAIIATHKLGIRFLWVGSICTIQDDPEDMA
jgi:hypothetical protein